MAEAFARAARVAIDKHPRLQAKRIYYGTAGFRAKAEELDFVMFRMGLLAVLRSKATQATVGVMITASHNPEEDNGVKLIDPLGDMLEAAWEILATHLVNVDDDELVRALEHIVFSTNIDSSHLATVFIARDTRPSSPALAEAVKDGVDALYGMIQDFEILTTPQLHYIVCCKNTRGKYGDPTEEGYYRKIGDAFSQFRGNEPNVGNYMAHICVDGANGVGALKLKEMMPYLGSGLTITLYNDGSGRLNYLCGADYVKIQQKPPDDFPLEAGMRCISFDGDADRIVYFYLDKGGVFHLLDGDKISALIASYLQELLFQSSLELHLGVVQTAYANGSSTEYIMNTLNIPVACVPTGVKHLHHRANQFDIGVYFEANGHGTVVFSPRAQQRILDSSNNTSLTANHRQAAQRLNNLMNIINQTVGDAISDMLAVESILQAREWNIEEWDAIYTDLPNRQLKVKVQDRSTITTSDAERRCETPVGLQSLIDSLVKQYSNGRAFVRPSGTEDIVRVYAEADTQKNADKLAYEVSLKVYDQAGGVGDKPSPPK